MVEGQRRPFALGAKVLLSPIVQPDGVGLGAFVNGPRPVVELQS